MPAAGEAGEPQRQPGVGLEDAPPGGVVGEASAPQPVPPSPRWGRTTHRRPSANPPWPAAALVRSRRPLKETIRTIPLRGRRSMPAQRSWQCRSTLNPASEGLDRYPRTASGQLAWTRPIRAGGLDNYSWNLQERCRVHLYRATPATLCDPTRPSTNAHHARLPRRRTLRLACGLWRTRYLTGRS